MIHLQRIQDPCAVSDDHQSTVGILLELLHALGHDTHCIHIQTGVGFIQNGKSRIQHQHLKDLCLLLLAAGEAHIQITIRIGLIHSQKLHLLFQILSEVPETDPLSGALIQCVPDEVGQRNARYLYRVLEGQEHTCLCTVCRGFLRQIPVIKTNGSLCDLVVGISHKRMSQS